MARTDQRTNLIKGTATNDSATAGYVGEYVSSEISTSTSYPSSSVRGDLTSISLTAGDWDVTGTVMMIRNGATVTENEMALSTTSGDSTATTTFGINRVVQVSPTTTASEVVSNSIPCYRYSLSATTTIYLKYEAIFSVATPQARGRISARRVR